MPSPVGHALGGVIAGLLVQFVTAARPWAGDRGLEPGPDEAPPTASDDGTRLNADNVPLANSGNDDHPTEPASRLAGSPVRRALVFAALGILPDLDFAVRAHNQFTHGLGAALLIGLAAYVAIDRRFSSALACAVAYGSHTLLDWLGSDLRPPIGIMALWPFSREHYQSSLHWFMAIDRRYWLPEMWSHNLLAVTWEVMMLAPLAAVAWWLVRRQQEGK